MRVAVLCDVHGNLPALEAVLAEVASLEVDRIVCGGDVVVGPFPRECLERLVGLDAVFVRGNADRRRRASVTGTWEWIAERARPARRSSSCTSCPRSIALGGVRYCHGSPRSDEEILTRVSSDERIRAALAGVEERLVVGGHTHVQFERVVDGIRLVNAGSVGMPYEGRAGRLLGCSSTASSVEFRQTPYAVEAAVVAIQATGYPGVGGHELGGSWSRRIRTRCRAYFESIAT